MLFRLFLKEFREFRDIPGHEVGWEEAVATAREEAGPAQAIDGRKLIGEASGILMERFDIDADRAFAVLRRYSQSTNTKLRASRSTSSTPATYHPTLRSRMTPSATVSNLIVMFKQ